MACPPAIWRNQALSAIAAGPPLTIRGGDGREGLLREPVQVHACCRPVVTPFYCVILVVDGAVVTVSGPVVRFVVTVHGPVVAVVTPVVTMDGL